MKKELIFEIQNKIYKINIGNDIKGLEEQVKKLLDLNKNITISELLEAFIKQSFEVVQLNEMLLNLANIIDKKLDE